MWIRETLFGPSLNAAKEERKERGAEGERGVKVLALCVSTQSGWLYRMHSGGGKEGGGGERERERGMEGDISPCAKRRRRRRKDCVRKEGKKRRRGKRKISYSDKPGQARASFFCEISPCIPGPCLRSTLAVAPCMRRWILPWRRGRGGGRRRLGRAGLAARGRHAPGGGGAETEAGGRTEKEKRRIYQFTVNCRSKKMNRS